MKNIMFKSTLREIKGSLGRWAAILAIIALGVGFFSGLKACKSAFLETGNEYLSQHNFFDYELISTLGLEDEDVENISAVDGVRLAEGSYSADVLITEDSPDSQDVTTKFLTVSDNINTPSLTAGRLPENPDECLGDPQYFTESDIGRKIYISSNNAEDTLDMLAYDCYTITGIADTPLYLNFERGSSSIGDGSIACFIMILPEGFSSEVYTEIYLLLEDSAYIFSDEYEEITEKAEEPLTAAIEAASQRRYDEIVGEARHEISEGEAELEDAESEVKEAEKELSDGEARISDGEAQIAAREADIAKAEDEISSGKKQLEDGQKQINESFELLESGEAEYSAALAEFEQQESQAYSQLEAAYAAGYLTAEQYEAQKSALDSRFEAARSALDETAKELSDNRALLESKQKELDESAEALAEAEAELENGKREIADAKAELADARVELEEGRAELDDGKAELEDARAELEDAKDQIDDVDYPDSYALNRETNVGYVCFNNDTSIVEGLAEIFPLFFFLVAALVCMTTMSRMIEEQRTQIGVLKALGYSSGQILKKYIFYSGSSALIGGVSGFFAGTYIFTTVIWEAYKMMYEFSDVIIVFDWLAGVLALLAAMICSVGTTFYSCYHELGEVPAQLIRPKAPAAGKRIFLEYVPLIWNRLRFLQKVSIRNVFRYKKRFFMMILGICGCTALLVTGFGIRDSIKNVVSMQYDEIFHVDYEVTFDHNMSEEDQAEFLDVNSDYIDSCLFLYTGAVDARMNGQVKSVNLVVCSGDDNIDDFIDLHNDDGHLSYPQKGQGIINSNLATVLDVEVGDEITVQDSDMNSLTVKISGLCDNYVYNYLYINDETYVDTWGEAEINSAFILGADDGQSGSISGHETGSRIAEADGVSNVSVTEDFRNRIDNTMQSLDYVVALIIICAAALAFIVLYNLTNINITERIREIATIKVLGFYPRETSSYVFRENVVLTAIAALVGIPLGTILHRFVMTKIQVDLMSFDVHITLLSYILSVAGTFVFAIIVNLVMRRKLDKISMTESLKSIE